MDLKKSIREVPGFPKPGILFYDITTLLHDPRAFKEVLDRLTERYKGRSIDSVVAVESRGFIFGGALADRLGCAFVPVRKPGKLPWRTRKVSYQLEYGQDTLCIHEDAVKRGDNVLIFDDLLATGGTAAAVARLVTDLGGTVEEIGFVIELTFLNGRDKLKDYEIFSLLQYDVG